MASKVYKVASPEGAVWAQVEEGEEIERNLDSGQERALIAAGWLEEANPKSKEK